MLETHLIQITENRFNIFRFDIPTRQICRFDRDFSAGQIFSQPPLGINRLLFCVKEVNVSWQENPEGLLFPNRNMRPRKREYVVKFGLKPLLRKFGLPVKDVWLHAFRHGLGTALSNGKVPPKTVQQILRHSAIKTIFRYYVRSDAQRSALETIQLVQRADWYSD